MALTFRWKIVDVKIIFILIYVDTNDNSFMNYEIWNKIYYEGYICIVYVLNLDKVSHSNSKKYIFMNFILIYLFNILLLYIKNDVIYF